MDKRMLKLKIRRAAPYDIPKVSVLESLIEGKNAASLETLEKRFAVFPRGFIVAESPMGIAGYAESCRWNLKAGDFETFEQIKNFPAHHKRDGKNLYVIFVAVKEDYKKQGIGSDLVNTLVDYAEGNEISKVQLVSKEKLVPFYKKLGFASVAELPDFLPDTPPHTFMEKYISPRSRNV